MTVKITRSEILLLLLSVVLTVSLALVLIRWIAPGLLGIAPDLVLVQSDEKVLPFYENIFLKEHWSSSEFMLQDPFVNIRAKPLYPDTGALGPNDLLGFRNSTVPVAADVVVIGDSQTYGNNAIMWNNWPHFLQGMLPLGSNVYSMATGGWTALQYYYVFLIAPLFSPKAIVIAFYTGNDPLETYTFAIASGLWKEFLPSRNIADYGTPSVVFPPPENEQWPVVFADGVKTIFSPKLRHSSNMKHPAVDAGYEIMHNVALKMGSEARKNNLDIIFTIIPTKEYVYSEKLKQSEIEIDPEYQKLIDDEGERIRIFSAQLQSIKGVEYVDVVSSLQKAAMQAVELYPKNGNGHPTVEGYNAIALALAPAVQKYVKPVKDGYVVSESQSGVQELIFVEDGKFWFIRNPDQIDLVDEPQVISSRKLTALLNAGHITIPRR